MNKTKLQLMKAPIIEAVLDIDCDMPPGFDLEAVETRARELFRDKYPQIGKQLMQEHSIQVKPDEPPTMSVRHATQSLQFLQQDGKQLVQVRAQGFSFNRLAPYTSLDDYMPEIERTWRLFVSIASPVQIRNVRLRYINRILLPAVEGRTKLEDYLGICPHLPDEERLTFTGFLNQHSAIEKDTGHQVVILLTTQPPENKVLPLIFDIITTSSRSADVENWAWLAATIQALRGLKNRRFPKYIDRKMPEPVSTTIGICWLTYAAAQGVVRRNTAVSLEAQAIRDAVTAVADWTEQSQALFGKKAAAISSLRAMVNECGQAGWEADESAVINPAAVMQAENFIRALPESIPLPEFSLEPDGSISLDWLQSRSRLFSLSIGATDRLAFAWLDGTDKGHGVARFDGQTLPARVLEGIESITSCYASLRVA
ncbi:MAG TPA: TIGR04255 family protein [Clostridia bacterium]|nr:TIGR04255 family protein [Clostridia bacterium]